MAFLNWHSLGRNSVTLYVDGLNTTTTYREIFLYCNGRKSDNLAKIGVVSSTSKEWEITGLTCGTRYPVSWDLLSAGGSVGGGSAAFTTDTCPLPPNPPGSVPWVSASDASSKTLGSRISVSWGSAPRANDYIVGLYLNGSRQTYNLVSGTSTTFTGVNEYTTYEIGVYARNSDGDGPNNRGNYVTTADITGPVLYNVSGDGNGRAYISYDAYDNGIGMRSTSTYYVEISNANGSTYGNGTYTTSKFRTFTADGNGNTLVHDAYYYMRVTAYDASGNTSVSSVRVQYKAKRPDNWTWHTAKIAGQSISLTATEWNSFCTRLNQFRIYKNLANYDFTEATSGQSIRAFQLNEARTAIQQMVPPTTTPSATSSGSDANASFINALRDSLNSIK